MALDEQARLEESLSTLGEYTLLDNADDYKCKKLSDWFDTEEIPIDAFENLEDLKEAGYTGEVCIYYKDDYDDNPVNFMGLNFKLEFAGVTRTVIIKVYEWEW